MAVVGFACLSMASPADGMEVELRAFEILHLKLLKVFTEAGVSAKYLGATSLTTEDRHREFVCAAGCGWWVVRRVPIEGIDPSSELGRVCLVDHQIEGSQAVKLGDKSYYVALYDTRGLCINRPMSGLAISADILARKIREMNDEPFEAKKIPINE